jgi:hypothetical protein
MKILLLSALITCFGLADTITTGKHLYTSCLNLVQIEENKYSNDIAKNRANDCINFLSGVQTVELLIMIRKQQEELNQTNKKIPTIIRLDNDFYINAKKITRYYEQNPKKLNDIPQNAILHIFGVDD